MTLRRLSLLGLVVGALFVAQPSAADNKSGVITLSDESGIGRPYSYLVPHRRVLEGARRSLTACYELALAEFARTSTEVDADISISPNGEVTSVAVSSRGAVGEAALRCVRKKLTSLAFDAPGGTGTVLRVAIVMGEPHADDQPALPFRVDREMTLQRPSLGPIVMRLTAQPPPLASTAVRLLKNVAESCASSNKPASAITVSARMFVADEGSVVKVEAASAEPAGADIAKCLRDAKWRGAGPRVSRVDVKVAIAPSGEVSFAR